MNSNTDSSYFFPSSSDINAITYVKLAFACLGVLTSIVAAGTLIPKCRLLVYKIVFYAIIANGLHITIGMMEFFPVRSETANVSNATILVIKNGTGWSTFCEVLGFLGLTTDWSGHLCMTWVIVYVLRLLVKEKRLEEAHCSKNEIVGIALCLLVPFTFNWIPLLHGFYGFYGGWCWIKMSDYNDNYEIGEGLFYMFMLYYGPLMCFVLFNIFSGFFIAVRYLFSPKYRSRKFSLLLASYPLAYGILCIVGFISHIKVIVAVRSNKQQSLQTWILETIVDSLQTIIPSTVVILCFCRIRRRKRRKRSYQCNSTAEINEKTKLLKIVHNTSS